MNFILERAKEKLLSEAHTCVIISDERVYTSKKRGVAPLIELIDRGVSLEGAFAADKVVGAGAAHIYVLMKVSELWTITVSNAAKEILDKGGVAVYYDNCVPFISNRANDGVCPMESAVKDALSSEDALQKMKKALKKMNAL